MFHLSITDLYEATGELLGQGSQGAVHRFVSRKTDVDYAVKVRIMEFFSKTIRHFRQSLTHSERDCYVFKTASTLEK